VRSAGKLARHAPAHLRGAVGAVRELGRRATVGDHIPAGHDPAQVLDLAEDGDDLRAFTPE